MGVRCLGVFNQILPSVKLFDLDLLSPDIHCTNALKVWNNFHRFSFLWLTFALIALHCPGHSIVSFERNFLWFDSQISFLAIIFPTPWLPLHATLWSVVLQYGALSYFNIVDCVVNHHSRFLHNYHLFCFLVRTKASECDCAQQLQKMSSNAEN